MGDLPLCVGGRRHVDDCGLGLAHHRKGVPDALRAYPRLSEALEWEMVGATCGRAIHLHAPLPCGDSWLEPARWTRPETAENMFSLGSQLTAHESVVNMLE